MKKFEIDVERASNGAIKIKLQTGLLLLGLVLSTGITTGSVIFSYKAALDSISGNSNRITKMSDKVETLIERVARVEGRLEIMLVP